MKNSLLQTLVVALRNSLNKAVLLKLKETNRPRLFGVCSGFARRFEGCSGVRASLGGCWKGGNVHTVITPEIYDNAALFLLLGLTFTLIRRENGAL